jgi:hypothetical protein
MARQFYSVPIVIGGEEHRVRYDFGAFREIREHFGISREDAKGFDWLSKVFSSAEEWVFPEDIVALITAGLRGGSMPDATMAQVERMLSFDEVGGYIEAISGAIKTSNTGDKEMPASPPPASSGVASPTMTILPSNSPSDSLKNT